MENQIPIALQIPGYTLLAEAGKGGYGEVYLAKSDIGQFRAVKVVYRDRIGSTEAFDREFRGAKAYERVSRKHPGLIDILHLGRDDDNGLFYYVMDPADDTRSGAALNPDHYQPRTLRSYLATRIALPVEECIRIGIELASALEFLQENGLVHRDIKPSNIVFVEGHLKLADIGLVAESSEAKSIVGTEGYTPPENHGTFAGDVYSLGKLLHEITTGRGALGDAPAPEADTDDPRFAPLCRIIEKACAEHHSDRLQTAKALRKALEELAGTRPIDVEYSLKNAFYWVGRRLIAVVLIVMAYVYVPFLIHWMGLSIPTGNSSARNSELHVQTKANVDDPAAQAEAKMNEAEAQLEALQKETVDYTAGLEFHFPSQMKFLLIIALAFAGPSAWKLISRSGIFRWANHIINSTHKK